ncbi:MAG TPA: transcriptional regulator, partial [Clostridia bacterium]|nr:transcriptional regulator [Clostridia bacterium]
KTWRVDRNGSYLENAHVSSATVKDLKLEAHPFLAVKIGVSPEAEHVGGLNLFGRAFGDFPQDILLRVGYTVR